jgi:hypothetical protein
MSQPKRAEKEETGVAPDQVKLLLLFMYERLIAHNRTDTRQPAKQRL